MNKKHKVLYYLTFMYFLEIGLILIFLPWMEMWDRNFTLFKINYIGDIMKNLYVRGAISGLGIVTIIIAFTFDLQPRVSC